MKACWFDIETTGLNPHRNQILEIGLIIDDLDLIGTKDERPIAELPSFHCYVMDDDADLMGHPIALSMNAGILEKMSAEFKRRKQKTLSNPVANFYGSNIVVGAIFDFVWKNQVVEFVKIDAPVTIVAGGKNFARFDEKFLSKLPNWDRYFKIRHRVLDPVNFFMQRGDTEPPDLKKCLERAGIIADVPHTAVEDAGLACAVYREGLKRMWNHGETFKVPQL